MLPKEESHARNRDSAQSALNKSPMKQGQQRSDEQLIQTSYKSIMLYGHSAQDKHGDSATGQVEEAIDRRPKEAKPSTATCQASRSLYEELFPEEEGASVSPSPPRKIVIKPFEWNKGLVGRWDHFNSKAGLEKYPPIETQITVFNAAHSRQYEVEADRDTLKPVVVVLDGASPNLEESDFFRITPKGAHIEGWTSGILKGSVTNSVRCREYANN